MMGDVSIIFLVPVVVDDLVWDDLVEVVFSLLSRIFSHLLSALYVKFVIRMDIVQLSASIGWIPNFNLDFQH